MPVGTLEDLHGADGARLRRIHRRVNLEAAGLLQARRPAVAQVAQARRLPLDAHPFVEAERLGDRVVVRGRVRPDLLELADVLVPGRGGGGQRPQRLDVLAPHVEKAGPDRREQPLVQAGAVEVAAEIRGLVREVRERVRAVDDRLHALGARRVADLLHRKNLPGEIRDVAEVQDPGLRPDRRDQAIREIVHRRRRHRERNLLHRDALAPRALVPRVEHPPVVLVRRDDFVPGLEIDPELRDLQRLARVARDRHLLGTAAELRREPAAHRLDVRLEDLPHVVHGRLVGDVEIALEGLVDDARAGAAAAVVQVDDRAIERESLLDVAPVGFIARDIRRRQARRARARRRDAREALVGERGERHRARRPGPEKAASADHRSLQNA